jgi:hypothetical protein
MKQVLREAERVLRCSCVEIRASDGALIHAWRCDRDAHFPCVIRLRATGADARTLWDALERALRTAFREVYATDGAIPCCVTLITADGAEISIPCGRPGDAHRVARVEIPIAARDLIAAFAEVESDGSDDRVDSEDE